MITRGGVFQLTNIVQDALALVGSNIAWRRDGVTENFA